MSDLESDDDGMECGQQPPGSSANQSIVPALQEDDRRAHHNALERKRRDHIKDSFTSLREVVPTLKGEKASRALILKKAADYIHMLKDDIDYQRNDIAQIRKQNDDLIEQLKYIPTKPQPRPPMHVAPLPTFTASHVIEDGTVASVNSPLFWNARRTAPNFMDLAALSRPVPVAEGHDYLRHSIVRAPAPTAKITDGDAGGGGGASLETTLTSPSPLTTAYTVPGLVVRPNVNAAQTPAHQNYILLTGKKNPTSSGNGVGGDTAPGAGTSRDIIVKLTDT
uniref:BHLH domain-containing protein n=1 Tax=Romanomermis culicivorax TaxID=13658 RepID=A0A915JU94_ROMCU